MGAGGSPEGFPGAFPRCVGRRCSPAGLLSSEGLRPVRHLEFRRVASLVRATERGLPRNLTHGKDRAFSPLEQRLIRVGVFDSCIRTEITGAELNPRPLGPVRNSRRNSRITEGVRGAWHRSWSRRPPGGSYKLACGGKAPYKIRCGTKVMMPNVSRRSREPHSCSCKTDESRRPEGLLRSPSFPRGGRCGGCYGMRIPLSTLSCRA